jgi:hypothetical protein
MDYFTKKLPEPVCLKIYEVLKRVYPMHIDEFGFYRGKKLLFFVFPAMATYQSYVPEEKSLSTLGDSYFQLKKREVMLGDVNRMRAVSEEVKLDEAVEFPLVVR